MEWEIISTKLGSWFSIVLDTHLNSPMNVTLFLYFVPCHSAQIDMPPNIVLHSEKFEIFYRSLCI